MDRDPSRTDGVVVSGQEPLWMMGICWFVGISSIILGSMLLQRGRHPAAVPVLLLGFALVFCGAIVPVMIRRNRRFILPTDDGFVYLTAQGERAFQDDDIMCVSLSQQQNYFWGNLQTVTRRFIIWVETTSIPERIVCISHLKPGMPDPLNPFVVRIINELHQAAQDAYRHGERVEGDGWALERGQLLLKSARSTSVIAIEDLSAIEIVDSHVNIWRKGNDLPIGRIPEKTANAHLLVLMLNDLMSENHVESEANLPPGHLGRMIFERRLGSRTSVILGWSLVCLLSLLTLLMTLSAVMEQRRPRRRIQRTFTAIVLGALTITGSSLLMLQRRARFRRHAFGIHQRGMFTDRRLRYSEIANVSYVAIRRYSHGIYNGTTLTMRFVPMPALGLRPISYSGLIQNADAELDRLRDEISLAIAERMQDFWKRHGNCPWVPFLQFQGESLNYSRLTFTGRRQPVEIPLASIVNFDMSDGAFHVWVEGQKKPVINEETSQPNFFPGLVFFSKLMNQELTAEPALENGDRAPLAD
ncbi:MAG: hypothetical protein V4719_17415 [Planctomycetota bacterium]